MYEVSFIIPAFNEALSLPDCIKSVQDEIKRRFDLCGDIRAEIIVVDNASTDETPEIAEDYGARVVYEPRKGVVRARQRGYLSAKFGLLANLDADCIMPLGWLDKALEELDDDTVAVSGPLTFIEFSPSTKLVSSLFYGVGKALHYTIGEFIQGGNFLIRKSALDAMGGYNTELDFWGEDVDIGRRAAKVGHVKFILGLKMYSSARRYQTEGLVKTTAKYVINYLSITLRKGKPIHKEYNDIR